MLTYNEINQFLTTFKPDSYNRSQIGNNKQLIISVYEFLNKLNIDKENINILLSNIAYLNKENLNIPLYLEILSKSIGFMSNYELKSIIKTTKEIHDIYFKHSGKISLEDYLHETNESRLRKIFLNRNNKYIPKEFNSKEAIEHICNLKLASAIVLDQKDYKEFMSYIDTFDKYKDSYSPLIVFKTYCKVRTSLKDTDLMFWDIFFGNEYIVALSKHNIEIKDLYKENVYGDQVEVQAIESNKESVQLDLFSYQEETKKETLPKNINYFQICTIYNSKKLPDFDQEKDLLLYYKKLVGPQDTIILPKLKSEKKHAYLVDMN